MLKRIIVHIGHDKTGTTSLQETFAANAGRLEAAGLAYPVLSLGGVSPAHHSVSAEFGFESRPFQPGEAWEAYRTAALSSPAETAFFSSEGLARIPIVKATEILKTFASIAHEVDILLYVRHPVHYASSAVSQGLRIGRALDEIIAAPPLIDQAGMARRWQRAYEDSGVRGRVCVRPFLRDVDPAWNLIDDVLDVCALADRRPHVAPVRSDANPGLCALGVYIVDWINRERTGEPLEQASLVAFNQLRGPSYVLPVAVRARVTRKTAASMAWLREHHGITLEADETTAETPCPLPEDELASLARVLLMSTQFGFEVERSRVGRWFGFRSPFPTRPLSDPVFNALQRFGLLHTVIGDAGARARTVQKRLGDAAAPAPQRAPASASSSASAPNPPTAPAPMLAPEQPDSA